MKSFKIIGFLAVVLFLGIFWRQEVWAEDCESHQDCFFYCGNLEKEAFCDRGNNMCDCIECTNGTKYDPTTYSCKSLCGSNEEWSQFLNQCQPKVGQTKCPDGYVSSGTLGGCVKASNPSSGGASSGSTGGSAAISTVATVKGDQRCWTEAECIKYRADTFKITDEKELKDGFYSAAEHDDAKDACGLMRGADVMGFCAPGSVATTQTHFGSVNMFINFGTFIKYIYKYSFVVAGVLGVLMILVAGVQWLTSAGSQEKIGAAKKRIIGAVIGLLILSLSYTILNFVNPYLVNFRLPQVWILNTSSYAKEFCRDLPDLNKTMFREISSDPKINMRVDEVKEFYAKKSFPLPYNETSFACGKQYIYTTAPNDEITCRGHYVAEENHICLGIPKTGYQPVKGIISGSLQSPINSILSPWDNHSGVDSDDIELLVICNNGEWFSVKSDSYVYADPSDGEKGGWSIVAEKEDINKTIAKCDENGKTDGFLICPEFDKNVGSKGVDWEGSDEEHWLGKKPDATGETSDAFDLGDGKEFLNSMVTNPDVAKSYLIPLNYLNGNKVSIFKLNINMNRITPL